MRLLLAATLIVGTTTTALLASPTAQTEDYDQLQAEYDQVSRYLSSKRSIGPDEKTSLMALREKLDAFAAANAEDHRPLVLSLQLSTWLGDEDRVDQAFQGLSNLSDDDRIWIAWAENRAATNRYEDAQVLLIDREMDMAKSPEAALVLAQCHIANNQFEEALAVINGIPEEGLGKPGVRGKQTRLKSQAEQWQKLWQDEIALREQEDAEAALPLATIKTNRGDITVLLMENQAPNTVANFITLAQNDFYNGQRFHDVVMNTMAMTGDPNSKTGSTEKPGAGGPGYRIPDESGRDDYRPHFAGVLAMDKNSSTITPGAIPTVEANSGGSRWYITMEPQKARNGEYTVFGRILEGKSTAGKLRKDDEITSITISRLRDKDYTPNTIPDATSADTSEDDAATDEAGDEAAASGAG